MNRSKHKLTKEFYLTLTALFLQLIIAILQSTFALFSNLSFNIFSTIVFLIVLILTTNLQTVIPAFQTLNLIKEDKKLFNQLKTYYFIEFSCLFFLGTILPFSIKEMFYFQVYITKNILNIDFSDFANILLSDELLFTRVFLFSFIVLKITIDLWSKLGPRNLAIKKYSRYPLKVVLRKHEFRIECTALVLGMTTIFYFLTIFLILILILRMISKGRFRLDKNFKDVTTEDKGFFNNIRLPLVTYLILFLPFYDSTIFSQKIIAALFISQLILSIYNTITHSINNNIIPYIYLLVGIFSIIIPNSIPLINVIIKESSDLQGLNNIFFNGLIEVLFIAIFSITFISNGIIGIINKHEYNSFVLIDAKDPFSSYYKVLIDYFNQTIVFRLVFYTGFLKFMYNLSQIDYSLFRQMTNDRELVFYEFLPKVMMFFLALSTAALFEHKNKMKFYKEFKSQSFKNSVDSSFLKWKGKLYKFLKFRTFFDLIWLIIILITSIYFEMKILIITFSLIGTLLLYTYSIFIESYRTKRYLNYKIGVFSLFPKI